MSSKTKLSDSCVLVVQNAETGEIKQQIESYSQHDAKLENVLRQALAKIEQKSQGKTAEIEQTPNLAEDVKT